jgi:hypothetical protein
LEGLFHLLGNQITLIPYSKLTENWCDFCFSAEEYDKKMFDNDSADKTPSNKKSGMYQ